MQVRPQALAAVTLAGGLSLTGCASDFQFELPEHHPARPSSPSSGALDVPSPFDIEPPIEASSEDEAGKMHKLHEGHGAPAKMREHGSKREDDR